MISCTLVIRNEFVFRRQTQYDSRSISVFYLKQLFPYG